MQRRSGYSELTSDGGDAETFAQQALSAGYWDLNARPTQTLSTVSRSSQPGSLNISALELAASALSPEDEIVVYCSGDPCPASKYAYHALEDRGYNHVRRYPGGVADWEEAGYEIEGDWRH